MSYIKDYIKMTSVRYLSSHDFSCCWTHFSCFLHVVSYV